MRAGLTRGALADPVVRPDSDCSHVVSARSSSSPKAWCWGTALFAEAALSVILHISRIQMLDEPRLSFIYVFIYFYFGS